jgi:hypothetical protein
MGFDQSGGWSGPFFLVRLYPNVKKRLPNFPLRFLLPHRRAQGPLPGTVSGLQTGIQAGQVCM